MKYFTFYRESNNFEDILKDSNLVKFISLKITFKNHLIIQFKQNINDATLGYLVLKYGDDIKPLVHKDFTPIPNVDYTPIRN